MRTVCIYRKGAAQRWRGKKVRWIVCSACRAEMIDFYQRNLKVFLRSEVKRFIEDMKLGASPTPGGSLYRRRGKLHTPKESDALKLPHENS